MMSVHRAVPVDQHRARKARTGERLSVAASLGIWALLVGVSWIGIYGLLQIF